MTENSLKPTRNEARSRAKRAMPIVLGLAGILSLSTLLTPILFETQTAKAQTSKPAPIINVAQSGFADLVDRVKASVVSIKVVHKSRRDRRRSRRWDREYHFGPNSRNRQPNSRDGQESRRFNEYFDRFGRNRDRKRRGNSRRLRRSGAQGSGFIISEDGYIVTNKHVIDRQTRVRVTLDGGKTYNAKVVGTDPKTDLALLKIEADRKLTPVKFASKPARVGDWVVAVGNPFGLGGTVTTGVVSANGRSIGRGAYSEYLQIDAAINKGNSGGPAFNLAGEVVGVNTAIISPSGGSVGIAFAIPASTAKHVIEQLKSSGKVTRGWLGVQIQRVTDDIADSLGLDGRYGTLIVRVTPDSPADKAGLKSGDTVLEVAGQRVRGPRDLARKISRVKPGSEVDIKLLRDGKQITKSVEIKALRSDNKMASAKPDRKPREASIAKLGIELRMDGDDDAVVIADVEPNSPAADKGLKPGDRILEVGGKKISSPREVRRELENATKKGRKAVLLLVRSRNGKRERFIALPLKKRT